MSQVLENRLSRLERTLGLADGAVEVEEEDDGDPIAGRAALLALLSGRLGPEEAEARIAQVEAEQQGTPRRCFSAEAKEYLRRLLATRSYGSAATSAPPVGYSNGFTE